MKGQVAKLIKKAASSSLMENELKRKYLATPVKKRFSAKQALRAMINMKSLRYREYANKSASNPKSNG